MDSRSGALGVELARSVVVCYFVFVDVGGLAIAMSHHDMPTIGGMEAFLFLLTLLDAVWEDRG